MPCPLCGDGPGVEMFSKGRMQVTRCDKCYLVYNRYQPNDAALKVFYQQSSAMKNWAEFKKSDLKRQSNKFSAVREFLQSCNPERLLDIGCGNGFFLQSCKAWIPSCDLMGIDPSPEAVEIANANGLNVLNIEYENLAKTSIRFNAITAFGVLEHIKDPIGFIRLCKSKLAKDGYIIICVPNAQSSAFQIMREKCFTVCPQHLTYWDTSSLDKLFNKFNMRRKETYLIEDESGPIMKYLWGREPYDELSVPECREMLKHVQETGIRKDYKVIGIYQ